MAHEMYHCFQYSLIGAPVSASARPAWIIEGQAEWVGEALMGPSTLGRDWWGKYLRTPGTGLFTRTYDAVGFYEHLGEEGIDPWAAMDPMLQAVGSSTDAFKAAGAAADPFLDTWASGLFRDPAIGTEWNVTGRWTTSERQPPADLSVAAGQAVPLAAPAMGAADDRVASSADIVEIKAPGHVRIHATGVDQVGADDLFLCLKGTGCECPDGGSYDGPPLKDATAPISIALTGAFEGAAGTVVGHGLEEYCQPDSGPAGHLWNGIWASGSYPISGTFTLELSQNGSALSGQVSITGSDCLTGGAVSGTIEGNQISFGVVAAEQTIHWDGVVSGTTMQGSYTTPSCGKDAGTWSASR